MTRRRLEALLRRRAEEDELVRAVRAAARAVAVEVRLVGGFVRDAALGARSTDLDLAAGRGTLRLVRQLEARLGARAFRFRKRGITTWRLDVGGRRLDLVDAGRHGLDRDLERRELTINAIGFDLARLELIDPLRGLADLRRGLLRAPRPGVIDDDPVRALRVARFLSQLPGFRTHRDLERQAARAAAGLRRAAAERVREELDKLLMGAEPARGLEWLARLDLIDAVLPELAPLRDCVAGAGRPDVWRHTLDCLARSGRPSRLPGASVVRDAEARRILRWSLLLHDISKPETLAFAEDGRPSFHGHEVLGARRADAVLERLRMPRRDRRRVGRLILFHLRPGHLADAGGPPRGLSRLVRQAGEDLPLLVLHAALDAAASGSPDAARRFRALRRILVRLLEQSERARRRPLPRLVDGRELMRALELEPGPEIGRILEAIREAQEEGLVRTSRQALRLAKQVARESPAVPR